ncbi:uncharacterized protein LOC109836495 isoform X2 [Asparagus officinalis]|nr:uncharacterized protein LOC109836495 isoform X2 [Asparagus officinalis]
MASMDEPLDFENEDPLLSSPSLNAKRRKVIGLDDLINDYYREQDKLAKKKSKKATTLKGDNSDEEDDKTKMLSKVVNDCQKQVNKMCTDDDVPLWGQKIFGHQKSALLSELKEPVNCELLQSFKNNELNSFFDLNTDGESFMNGLLMNGWLSKLALARGFVEDSIASWTFHTLLYSSNKELQVAACDFWCKILLSIDEADRPLVRFEWFPTFSKLKNALEAYGYLSDTPDSSVSTTVSTDLGCEGPPENIWSWINIVSACCRFRSVGTIFSASEAADLLAVIVRIYLDRQLQGLSVILNECMQSVISFFSDSEWDFGCKKVAHSVACRIPKDLNCLRIVECISGVGSRSKNLRSQVALQTLILCFNEKVSDGKEILNLLTAMNVKDKNCDFVKLYIYLVLVENWLLCYHSIEERDAVLDLWCKYLRNCSSQITSTDWRSYASKVRNKASYLLQNSTVKEMSYSNMYF